MTAAAVEIAIPCLNEAASIQKVIRDFRKALPQAAIVVYDNGSTDRSVELARSEKVEVRTVARLGKGFVVQAILEQSRADVVLMVDGDDTYEAADAPLLLQPVLDGGADMVIGSRWGQVSGNPFPPLHRLGNRMITALVNLIFGTSFRDILTGYRAFSRRFLESVPLIMNGFETETELILQSLELGFPVQEVPIRYRNRPAGSASKLRTFRDGFRILQTILSLSRNHRPLQVFGSVAVLLILAGLSLWGWGVAVSPGLRPAGVVLAMAGLATALAALMLDAVNTRFREVQSLLRRHRGS